MASFSIINEIKHDKIINLPYSGLKNARFLNTPHSTNLNMNVDEELIRRVATVARLKLSEEEVKKFVPQFKEILESFQILDEVDVSDTKMSMQPVEIRNVLREDVPGKCLSQEVALAQSKNHKSDGYFKGPKAV